MEEVGRGRKSNEEIGKEMNRKLEWTRERKRMNNAELGKWNHKGHS